MSKLLHFNYTNYAGKRSERKVEPKKVWFGENEYHPGAQWFLTAYDPSRNADRDFAVADIENKVVNVNITTVPQVREWYL